MWIKAPHLLSKEEDSVEAQPKLSAVNTVLVPASARGCWLACQRVPVNGIQSVVQSDSIRATRLLEEVAECDNVNSAKDVVWVAGFQLDKPTTDGGQPVTRNHRDFVDHNELHFRQVRRRLREFH